MVKGGEPVKVSILKIALVAAAIVPLCAQDVDLATDASIRQLEKEWTVGQSRNDDRVLDLLFDNALLYVEYGHLVSKAEYLARVKTQPPNLDEITMEPMRIQKFGNTAVVVGTYVEMQVAGGKSTIKRWRFIDTWVYKKNGWVLIAAGAAPVAQ